MIFMDTRRLGSLLLLALFSAAANARAQEIVFHLEPGQSHVDFTLGDVLHTVHGTFKMKASALQFDPATGKASGAMVVDATSGNTGNDTRDEKMHKDVLQSAKYPEFRFTVQTIRGQVSVNGSSELQLTGVMTIHGGEHPMTVTAPVQVSNAQVTTDAHFVIPYVQWGLKDPSTFLLRVDKKVDIVVHAVGSISPAQ